MYKENNSPKDCERFVLFNKDFKNVLELVLNEVPEYKGISGILETLHTLGMPLETYRDVNPSSEREQLVIRFGFNDFHMGDLAELYPYFGFLPTQEYDLKDKIKYLSLCLYGEAEGIPKYINTVKTGV